ncbi:MAG TPA: carboxypeptidase regulatory-like domain-containing protein [Anaeromyxobacteraceae bacterium]|nr:carboxypeptidase regulatory-like domain-containing protein [Anaeromyxobacteraceae bacterium]
MTRRRGTLLVASLAGIGLAAYLVAGRCSVPATLPATQPRWPQASPVTYAQSGSGVLRGRVLDESGPVPGASILVTSDLGGGAFSSARCPSDPGSSIFECPCAPVDETIGWGFVEGRGEATAFGSTTTGPDGTFRVAGLAGGRYAVWAESPRGHAMAADVAEADEVELVLGPGVRYAGSTEDEEGAPIPGATVAAVHRLQGRFFVTHSDGGGRFQIGPLPQGEYFIVSSSAGRVPDVDSSPSGDMALVLRPARRVEGTVVLDGKPVAGAEVRTEVRCSPVSTRTGADGRFVLGRLRPEKTAIAAFSGSAGGYATADLVRSDVTDLSIELRAGGTLVGEVRDEAGVPVAGARAALEPETRVRTEATTDAEGRFEVMGLPPGRYSVWLEPGQEFVKPGHRFVQVDRGEVARARFSLLRAAKLSGTVLDDVGRPIADAEIEGRRSRERAPLAGNWDAHGFVRARSDRLGRFAVGHAAPGGFALSVKAPGFLPGEVDASAPGDVTVTLARGGILELVVIDETGAPVPGADVTATTPHREGGESLRFYAKADADGRYAFTGLPSGLYRAVAQIIPARRRDRDHSSNVRTVAADATVGAPHPTRVHLRFDGGLTISGRTVEAGTGRALAGVEVLAEDEVEDPPIDRDSDVIYPEAGGGAISDAAGRFEIRHLRANPHRLRWTLDGFVSMDDDLVVRPGEAEVVLRLKREPALRGRVLDERGAPVERFRVDGRRVREATGRFELPIWFTGTRALWIDAEGFAAVRKEVAFVDGQDIDIGDVRLSRGRTLKVIVVEAGSGRPVGSAAVEIGVPSHDRRWLLEEKLAEGFTGSDGAVVFGDVPGVALHILVSNTSLAPAMVPLPDGVAELRVALGAGGRIEGSVRNAEGQPVRNVEVTASSFSMFRECTTGQDGRFAIEGLPADVYGVHLEEGAAQGNAGLSRRRVELPADGVVQVDFRESRGASLSVSGGKECYRLDVVAGGLALTAAGLAHARRNGLEPDFRRDGGRRWRGLAPGVYTVVCATEPETPGGSRRASLLRLEIGSSDVEASAPEPSVVVR